MRVPTPFPEAYPRRLFTRSEAASYLNTSERHVRELWSKRRISAVRVGGLIRFTKEDLDQFIQDNRVEAKR
jgi:excisionase family DNA binding protein